MDLNSGCCSFRDPPGPVVGGHLIYCNALGQLNFVLLAGLIYCSVAVHTSGFGSYKQLFGLLVVQNVFAHTLVALGIVIGIVMGRENAFTVPEVSGGGNGATWIHALIHLVAGFIVPVFAWLVGSVILFVTKKLKPA